MRGFCSALPVGLEFAASNRPLSDGLDEQSLPCWSKSRRAPRWKITPRQFEAERIGFSWNDDDDDGDDYFDPLTEHCFKATTSSRKSLKPDFFFKLLLPKLESHKKGEA